ncbi:MAG: hypothetical protein Kow0079_00320 [Vicingaceae bacterium]
MKKLTLIIITLIVTQLTFAQETYKAENEGWEVDINKAYELSKKTGKPIMANFTGSDWCGWCKRLKFEVFDKEEFKKWAAENVVLLELDFPRKKFIPDEIKKQNYSLQQAFGVTGYPTIWVFYLDQDTETKQYQINAVGKTGYMRGGPTVFTKSVEGMIENAKKKENADSHE